MAAIATIPQPQIHTEKAEEARKALELMKAERDEELRRKDAESQYHQERREATRVESERAAAEQ